MACDPVQNCKSRRCAQAGVCNCLIVYSDGSQLPGSGTGDDPYVIELPPIKAIRDSAGNLLTPDANRVVQLPSYIQKIVSAETGIEYTPDTSGRVVLPVNAISTLSFRDIAGNILTVESDDVITIGMDGDEGVMQGYDTPIVDPIQKKITFPGFKVYEYSTLTSRQVLMPGVNGVTNYSTDILDFIGPNTVYNNQNAVYHPLSVSLQLFFGANPYSTANNDYFTFDLFVDHNTINFSEEIATNLAFVGDKAQCYNTYFVNRQIISQSTDDLTLRLRVNEVQMDSYRRENIRADVQVMGYWV